MAFLKILPSLGSKKIGCIILQINVKCMVTMNYIAKLFGEGGGGGGGGGGDCGRIWRGKLTKKARALLYKFLALKTKQS